MVLWGGGLIKACCWRFELLTVLIEGAFILEGCAQLSVVEVEQLPQQHQCALPLQETASSPNACC